MTYFDVSAQNSVPIARVDDGSISIRDRLTFARRNLTDADLILKIESCTRRRKFRNRLDTVI